VYKDKGGNPRNPHPLSPERAAEIPFRTSERSEAHFFRVPILYIGVPIRCIGILTALTFHTLLLDISPRTRHNIDLVEILQNSDRVLDKIDRMADADNHGNPNMLAKLFNSVNSAISSLRRVASTTTHFFKAATIAACLTGALVGLDQLTHS
jgi:hypothetical protein